MGRPVTWREFLLTVPQREAQSVADALLPFAYGGIVMEPAIESEPGTEEFTLVEDGATMVKAYLLADESLADKRHSLIEAASAACPGLGVAERTLTDADWAGAWRRHIKPLRIGDRLLVRPPWSRARAALRAAVVELEPGMAFGTGDHPTTRACLRALVDLIGPGARVLDLGTGSGILAVAAGKLGASRVLALDTDPIAVESAREACRRNGVEDRVQVVLGGIDAPESRAWNPDLILANLTSRLHVDLAPEIVRALPPGGSLVAAGIGESGLAGALAAYREAGARGVRIRRAGPWRSLRWTK